MDWTQLEESCTCCESCSLSGTKHNLVFGDGCKTAEIMFIGEGPGEQEDMQGIPFVGPAGKLLDEMLKIIDLDRQKVYIANIIKCRPPKNRDPLSVEQEACLPWLGQQIRLVNPKIIVCLGRIAATALISPEFKITREHGLWFDKGGIKYTAIYHPAALLRDPDKRPQTFVDLKSIQAQIKATCAKTY